MLLNVLLMPFLEHQSQSIKDDKSYRRFNKPSQQVELIGKVRLLSAYILAILSLPLAKSPRTKRVTIVEKGSRRRGRSHARSCCAGEDLQSLQTLNLIGRGGGSGRQRSPNAASGGQGQDQPASVVDYRRLVFISSDSSSGREEDDADSSCSSSSYLNGLPRNGAHHHHHAQSLEDCDWDYFESGSLPLPTTPIANIGAGVAGTADASGLSVGQDVWSCCPGRGSAACQVSLIFSTYVACAQYVRKSKIRAKV